jgi:pimeloyl-ACP methyl ester carboxylesterase
MPRSCVYQFRHARVEQKYRPASVFVEVVIHSYRHRFGYAGGDPSLEAIERRLAAKPHISVPTIVLHGDSGLSPPESSLKHAACFTGPYQRRAIPTAGHNLPQEARCGCRPSPTFAPCRGTLRCELDLHDPSERNGSAC